MITNAVIVHTTRVSMKVPSMAMIPWRTGLLVCAAACAMAADPSPGLIGEHAARDAEANGRGDGRAGESARRRRRRERMREYEPDARPAPRRC